MSVRLPKPPKDWREASQPTEGSSIRLPKPPKRVTLPKPPPAATPPQPDLLQAQREVGKVTLPKPPPGIGKKPTSKLESAIAGAAQGAAFGFADEIGGAIESITTGRDYTKARDAYRDYFEQAEKDNPYTYLGSEMAAGVGVAFVPGLGWLNTTRSVGAIASAGAAGGALYGAGHAKELEDVPGKAFAGGAFGAATGAAVGGLFKYLGRSGASAPTKKVMAATELDNIANGIPSPPAVRDGIAQMLEETDESIGILKKIYEQAGDLALPSTKRLHKNNDFVRFLMKTGNKKITPLIRKQAQEVIEGSDDALLQNSWTQYRLSKATKKVFEEQSEDLAAAISDGQEKLDMGFFSRWAEDPMFVSKRLDEVTGLDVESISAGFSNAGRMVSNDLVAPLAQLDRIRRTATKAFGKNNLEELGRYLDRPRAGREKFADPAKQAVADQMDEWFAGAKKVLESRGLRIKDRFGIRGGFFPTIRKDTARLVTELRKQLADTKTWDPNTQFGRSIRNLPGGEEVDNLRDAKRVVDNLLTQEGSKREITAASAGTIFDRLDAVPGSMREYDPFKAATRYLSTNLKAVHTRPHAEALRTRIQIMRGMGLNKHADYFERQASRIAGEPSGFYAWVQNSSNKWRVGIDQLMGDLDEAGAIKRGAYSFMRAAPDTIDWMTTTIYPNVMGLNIHAPLRNMTQTWVLTAPELKASFNPGSYGYRSVAKGWVRGIKNFRKTVKQLHDKGLLEDRPHLESARRNLTSEIYDVPGLEQLAKAADWWNDKVMTLYALSDTTNRVYAWKTAEVVAEDLLKGSKGAADFVKRLSGGVRHNVVKALKTGDEGLLKDTLGSYLVRKTQFNYGKAGLSQFGQEYGRVASMFTKWPVMVTSDMRNLVQRGEGTQMLIKYSGPLALAATANIMMQEMDAFEDPTVRTLFGRSVLSWAPATSVLGIQTPPLIDAALTGVEASKDALSGELNRAGGKVAKTLEPFVPIFGGAQVFKRRYLED